MSQRRSAGDPRYSIVVPVYNEQAVIPLLLRRLDLLLQDLDGAAVIVMDADLQDPPEVVGQMIERWKEGNDVVYGRRLAREGETRLKLWTASIFYKLLNRLSCIRIPSDTGDFRLVDRIRGRAGTSAENVVSLADAEAAREEPSEVEAGAA